MNQLLGIGLGLFAVFSFGASQRPVELTEEALTLQKESILIDGHNDLPWALREKGDLQVSKTDLLKNQPDLHTDIPKIKKGGLGAQFWSAYVPVETTSSGIAAKQTFEQIAVIRQILKKYPAYFEFASTADDIMRIRKAGKVASLIGVEGGHSMEGSLETLRRLYDEGTRYMTLTHSKNTPWADSCTDKPLNHGLSAFGEKVIAEMNRLGMFVDLSHVSAETMRHALRITKAPVIFSHSSAYAVKQHPRNVPDDVLQMMKSNGGVVMVNFYSGFVCDRNRRRMDECNVKTVVDHIAHIAKVAGIEHVGIGSDFDGVPTLPAQLSDVSYYPYVTQELLNRGFSHSDIKKILGENLLRAMKKMEEVSLGLRNRFDVDLKQS